MEEHKDEHQDLINISNRLRRRSQCRAERSQESVDRTRHQWVALAVGRICVVCRRIQFVGEMDDAPNCDVRKMG